MIEKGERNYSAYVPDLPGCVSIGDTPEQVKAEIREAIEFHLGEITVTHACFPFCGDYGDTCLFSLLCAAPRENSSAVPGKLSADLRPGTLKSILRQAGLKE